MDIRDLQKRFRDMFLDDDRERGPFFLMTVFMAEIGELADAIKEHRLESIREELGDILFTTLCLANLYDVDLDDVIKEKYLTRKKGEITESWKRDADMRDIETFIRGRKDEGSY